MRLGEALWSLKPLSRHWGDYGAALIVILAILPAISWALAYGIEASFSVLVGNCFGPGCTVAQFLVVALLGIGFSPAFCYISVPCGVLVLFAFGRLGLNGFLPAMLAGVLAGQATLFALNLWAAYKTGLVQDFEPGLALVVSLGGATLGLAYWLILRWGPVQSRAEKSRAGITPTPGPPPN